MVRTPLVIIGTLHLDPIEYRQYGLWLENVIEQVAPDIICAELSPEQLAGTQSCNSKPEQRIIVIPTAKRLNIPIVPIQPSTIYGLDWEQRYTAARSELCGNDCLKAISEFLDDLSQEEARSWRLAMHHPSRIEDLQLDVYDIFPAARDAAVEKFLPQIAQLMTEWNMRFLEIIESTIDGNASKRILVIAGLWHKYWLWNRILTRTDIELHNWQSFGNRQQA